MPPESRVKVPGPVAGLNLEDHGVDSHKGEPSRWSREPPENYLVLTTAPDHKQGAGKQGQRACAGGGVNFGSAHGSGACDGCGADQK